MWTDDDLTFLWRSVPAHGPMAAGERKVTSSFALQDRFPQPLVVGSSLTRGERLETWGLHAGTACDDVAAGWLKNWTVTPLPLLTPRLKLLYSDKVSAVSATPRCSNCGLPAAPPIGDLCPDCFAIATNLRREHSIARKGPYSPRLYSVLSEWEQGGPAIACLLFICDLSYAVRVAVLLKGANDLRPSLTLESAGQINGMLRTLDITSERAAVYEFSSASTLSITGLTLKLLPR